MVVRHWISIVGAVIFGSAGLAVFARSSATAMAAVYARSESPVAVDFALLALGIALLLIAAATIVVSPLGPIVFGALSLAVGSLLFAASSLALPALAALRPAALPLQAIAPIAILERSHLLILVGLAALTVGVASALRGGHTPSTRTRVIAVLTALVPGAVIVPLVCVTSGSGAAGGGFRLAPIEPLALLGFMLALVLVVAVSATARFTSRGLIVWGAVWALVSAIVSIPGAGRLSVGISPEFSAGVAVVVSSGASVAFALVVIVLGVGGAVGARRENRRAPLGAAV